MCKCMCKFVEGLGSGNAAKVCDIYPNKVGKQLTNDRLGREGYRRDCATAELRLGWLILLTISNKLK